MCALLGQTYPGSREGTKKGLSSGVNLCGSGSEDGAARVLSFGAGLSITGSTGPVTGSGSGLGSGSVSGKDAGSGLDSGSASGEDAGSGLGSGSRLGMISGSPRLPSGMFSIGPEKGVPCAFRWMLLSVSLEGCASNKGGVVGGVLFMSTSFGRPRDHRIFGRKRCRKRRNIFFWKRRSHRRRFLYVRSLQDGSRNRFADRRIKRKARGLRGHRGFFPFGLFRLISLRRFHYIGLG